MNFREVIRSVRISSNLFCHNKLFSLYLVFLQGLPGSIPWGVYSSYLHDILANEKHFSPDAVVDVSLFYVGLFAVHLLRCWSSGGKRRVWTDLPLLLPAESLLSAHGYRHRLSRQHAVALYLVFLISDRGSLSRRVVHPPRHSARIARRASEHTGTCAEEHSA